MSAEHTDIGAYSLGLLDERDRLAFEDHLASCPSCGAQIRTPLRCSSGRSSMPRPSPQSSVRGSRSGSVSSHGRWGGSARLDAAASQMRMDAGAAGR